MSRVLHVFEQGCHTPRARVFVVKESPDWKGFVSRHVRLVSMSSRAGPGYLYLRFVPVCCLAIQGWPGMSICENPLSLFLFIMDSSVTSPRTATFASHQSTVTLSSRRSRPSSSWTGGHAKGATTSLPMSRGSRQSRSTPHLLGGVRSSSWKLQAR